MLSAIVTVLVLYKLDFQFEFGVGGAIADAFINAAIPEEAAKLLMLWLVLRRNRHFDEYFDGVVYAVCVGMGFAGLENIFYLIDEEDMMAVGIARGVFSIPAHFMFAVAMGYYYQRQKDSLWQYLESDSILVAEENYVRGKKNGLETTYFPYGIPAEEINWKDGVKNGVWKRYHDIGTILFEANYVNGKLEGRYTKYNAKGEIELTGNYKNDVKHGEWREFDPKTKKFKVEKYVNGELENAAEADAAESQQLQRQSEEGKYLPDPVDFHNNPEEFFQRQ